MVGAGSGKKTVGQSLGPSADFAVNVCRDGVRSAHDVAVDIAASCQRSQSHLVDPADRLLQFPLEDAVQFQGLSRRQPQGAVAVLPRQLIEGQPLRGRDDSTRCPHAKHETIGGLELLHRAFIANVAVVLLVSAMELQQLRFAFRHGTVSGSAKRFDDRPAEIIAGQFMMLCLAKRFRRRQRFRRIHCILC